MRNRVVGGIALIAIVTIAAAIPDAEPLRKTVTVEIPYSVVYQFDRTLGPGRLVKVRNGIPGTITKVVEYAEQDGRLVAVRATNEVRTPPVDAVIAIGRQGFHSTRGSYTRDHVLKMHATGYSHEENTNWTATGLRAKFGVVAVDPRTIRLGTRVFVEGYGFAVAADTGGAIKRNRIDLCFNSRAEALRFGRKQVTVHVLE